ncbi:hypothetical protein PIROE2DRAFT_9908, partial [Piromyces sp. E2]
QTTTTTTTTKQQSSTTTTVVDPTNTPSLTTDGKCGSNNGKQCLDAQCCNGGSCVNMYDYSRATSYKQNVLLVLDTSSANMSSGEITKLNNLLKDLSSQLNSEIEIPYVTFASSGVKAKQATRVNVSSTTSSEANFASGLDMAIQFFDKYGKKKNGKQNVIVLYSAGNIVSSSFGSSFSNAVTKANTLKNSGVKIYSLNVNSAAKAGSSIAAVGSTVNSNDINTVMELLSSDYTNVSVSSSGSISSYTKSSSEYYRTPNSEDYTALYNDIIFSTLSSTKNSKCNVSSGCEAGFGKCEGVVSTTTITKVQTTTTTTKVQTTTTTTTTKQQSSTTTTVVDPTNTPSLTTDGKCGSNNGKQCLDAQCCNGGSCVNMYDYSRATSYKQNVLLVLDTSSANMSAEEITKLNNLLKDLSSQLNSEIEIPYVTFASSGVKAKQATRVSVSSTSSSEANFA